MHFNTLTTVFNQILCFVLTVNIKKRMRREKWWSRKRIVLWVVVKEKKRMKGGESEGKEKEKEGGSGIRLIQQLFYLTISLTHSSSLT
jgi:hypothetical protein